MKTAHTITNKRHNSFYGANSRFITRLKNPDDNYFVLLGGQDGWVGSPYLTDQIELWRQGQYIQVPLTVDSVKTHFNRRMDLQPFRP
jgi:penicillin amidase